MTVPRHSLKFCRLFRRIRSIVDFVPIKVTKSTGTVITVPYIYC